MTPTNFPTVNQAAFVVAGGLAAVAIGSTIAAVSVTSTVAAVALGILAVGSGAVSAGASWAWFETNDSTTLEDYFDKVKDHTAKVTVGLLQATMTALFQAAIEGFSQLVRRKIGGPDVTFQ